MEGEPMLENWLVSEEELYGEKKIEEKRIKIVTFRLEDEWYGVKVTSVKEVMRVPKITYLPSAPDFIAGIVSLRGNISSVTDLRRVFGLKEGRITDISRIVVIESDIFQTGLLVDEAFEVIDVRVSKIEPPLTTLDSSNAQYIEGEYRDRERLIVILNIEELIKRIEISTTH
jgi:purine-binding chemotaxis protein CheW